MHYVTILVTASRFDVLMLGVTYVLILGDEQKFCRLENSSQVGRKSLQGREVDIK